MKKEFDVIIKRGISLGDTNYFGKWVSYFTEKYGISKKTVYTRFKSYYSKSPREVISASVVPDKATLSKYILNSCCSEEVRLKTKLSLRQFTGIYDKVFGVSTFQKAKIMVLSGEYILTPRIPVREDNRSLLYSQLLGDGSYEAKKHSLRITHGIKQAEYLKFKVDLLSQGYPKLPKKISVYTHTQGHLYTHWYSGHLGNIDIPKKEEYSKLVEKLTPLGWLIWFLDDGSFSQNLEISSINKKIQSEAVLVLKTFGIESRQYDAKVIMCGEKNDVLFLQTFVLPYWDIIPSCMKYKFEDIVERFSLLWT